METVNAENISNVLDLKLETLIAAIRNKRSKSHLVNNASQQQAKKRTPPREKSSEAVFVNRFRAQKEMIQNFKTTIDKQEKLIKQLQIENVAHEKELVVLREQLKTKIDKGENVDDLNKSPLSSIIRVKTPEVLIRMNRREEERRRRRMQLEERKKLKEAQKLEEEILRGEEARRKQVELALLKKQEAILKKHAENEMKRRQGLLKIFTRVFHNKLTTITFLERWKMSVVVTRKKSDLCRNIFIRISAKKMLAVWEIESDKRKELRKAEAHLRRERFLENRYFSCWKNKYLLSKLIERAARKAYELEKIRHFFQSWHLYCLQAQVRREEHFETVRNVYSNGLYRDYFTRWRLYPKLMYEERERDKRIRQWYSSVQKIIPDFNV